MNGQMKRLYRARFTRRDTFNRLIEEVREFRACHLMHADRIAHGIAKSNEWTFVSVGLA